MKWKGATTHFEVIACDPCLKDGRLKLSACQPYLEPRYVVVLSLGGSGRGSCWSLAIHHVSMQHFQTPSFGYLAIFAAATEKPEHGEALGEALGHLFFWSGCEVGVNTCWWRMRELLVNTSPQILSLSRKIWIIYACPWQWQMFFFDCGVPWSPLGFLGVLLVAIHRSLAWGASANMT